MSNSSIPEYKQRENCEGAGIKCKKQTCAGCSVGKEVNELIDIYQNKPSSPLRLETESLITCTPSEYVIIEKVLQTLRKERYNDSHEVYRNWGLLRLMGCMAEAFSTFNNDDQEAFSGCMIKVAAMAIGTLDSFDYDRRFDSVFDDDDIEPEPQGENQD